MKTGGVAKMEEGKVLLLPLLDSTNFSSWKYRMTILLEERGLLDCVLKEQKEGEDLTKNGKKCKLLLISRLDDSQLEYVRDKKTPKEMWDTLHSIYERKSLASRMSLKKKLLSLKHQSGSLREHFLEFDKLVREYKATGGKIEDEDIICHLLLSLNSSYATLVTALETMPESCLTVDFVKSRLLDEETKQQDGSSMNSANVAPAAFSSLDGWQRKPQQQRRTIKCFLCKKDGHKANECPEKNKSTRRKFTKKSSAYLGDGDNSHGVCFMNNGKIPMNCDGTWIVDSGSSEHISNNKDLFCELRKLSKPVKISVAKENQYITALQEGDIVFQRVGNDGIPITLRNVLYVPEAPSNLLSIRKITNSGFKVIFDNEYVKVLNERGKLIVRGTLRGKLYWLTFNDSNTHAAYYTCGQIPRNLELWHNRFGHLSAKNLEILLKTDMVKGLKVTCERNQRNEKVFCEACSAGKQTRNPFHSREEKQSRRVLELIHSDVCGPNSPMDNSGANYFVTFIDDWSRYTMVFLMQNKSEVNKYFQEYEAIVSAKFGKRICRIRCDNGGEYKSENFLGFCSMKRLVRC